jgi:hypothetical protein
MDRTVQGRLLFGFNVENSEGREVMVSHLLFVDDTIIFCDADPSKIEHLGCVLTWFEAISGLKINLGKSEMVPVGDVPNMEELACILGCKRALRASLPMKYLGLPLGANSRRQPYGIRLLKKWLKDLQGERDYIYLKEVRSL